MKRITALLLSLTLLVSLYGCAQPVQPQESQSSPDVYPMTLTDQAGRTVTLQKKPERIVSGYYISTSLLIALGQKDKLVGIEAKADKRNIYRLSAPELLNLPNVGSAKEFDLEGCAALEPDLVILPVKLESAAATLEELDIPVLLVNPESRPLLDEAVDLVAQATSSQDRAQALAGFSSTQESRLTETLKGVERPQVYLAGNSSLLSTAGGQMYQNSMVSLAGGENVAQDLEDAYWVAVSYEQLLAWDPEYIILASDASYTCEDVLSDPNLAGCTAVVNGNVVQLPDKAESWDSPVPSGILGSVWLAGVLHPDMVKQESCDNVIETYYETFYGFSYSQA